VARHQVAFPILVPAALGQPSDVVVSDRGRVVSLIYRQTRHVHWCDSCQTVLASTQAEGGVCWQLPAEDPAVLAAGFGELAAQLGAAEGGDPVAAVHTVLAASSVPWLLVFDDAPDRATVARFLPPAGPGRVLITSRNQIWPPGQVLDVPVLDPHTASRIHFVSRDRGSPSNVSGTGVNVELFERIDQDMLNQFQLRRVGRFSAFQIDRFQQ